MDNNLIRIYLSTDMEELIRAIGYTEIREIFSDEIKQECDEAYSNGKYDAKDEGEMKWITYSNSVRDI